MQILINGLVYSFAIALLALVCPLHLPKSAKHVPLLCLMLKRSDLFPYFSFTNQDQSSFFISISDIQ